MITLFEHPLSPDAEKVKIALVERGALAEQGLARAGDALAGRDRGLEWRVRSGDTDIVRDGMRQRTFRFGAELC